MQQYDAVRLLEKWVGGAQSAGRFGVVIRDVAARTLSELAADRRNVHRDENPEISWTEACSVSACWT
jgi:hypothetical protein